MAQNTCLKIAVMIQYSVADFLLVKDPFEWTQLFRKGSQMNLAKLVKKVVFGRGGFSNKSFVKMSKRKYSEWSVMCSIILCQKVK